ncbi:MAG: SigB/SigF/SigG family RNA polymerase sigma factor [Erysipelotrichales bacterium]|nr:SigB/SigF/SigG family RNA polymerase sigma factor [Erysipelotrichales bacterium]
MARYKVDINGVNTANLKVLTNAEMRELFKQIKEGNEEARNELINGNLKLVLSMVQRFNGRHDNMDDLFQIGCVGLIKAIDNFDVNMDVKFSTYAVPMILGEIRRYLRDNQSLRISRHLKDLSYQIVREKEDYYSKNYKEASTSYLANKLGVKEKDIIDAIDSMQQTISIFEPVYSDNGDNLYIMDQITDNKDEVNDLLNSMALKKGLKNLNDKELYVIEKRFYEGKTQVEIAEEMNVSQAQISRLEKSALEELKKHF